MNWLGIQHIVALVGIAYIEIAALIVLLVIGVFAVTYIRVLRERRQERKAWREGTIRELAKERAHVARQYVETSYARRTR